jgi:Uma2 family endonuclease
VTSTPPSAPIVYPSSDGKRMAENTKQARWITVLYGNLLALYRDRADVFVGAYNLWYPVKDDSETRNAPDVYVVFGRPKGDRPSYVQWQEENVPLTVVFEVLSPGNTHEEMVREFHFYEDHGAQEYYVYDPDRNTLDVYVRGKTGSALVQQHPAHGFTSPRMGIRFDLRSGDEMVVYHPNGERFLTFEELTDERNEARRQRDELQKQLDESQKQLEALQDQRDAVQKQRDQAQQRHARAMVLSRKARRGVASDEELAELTRLEDEQAAS